MFEGAEQRAGEVATHGNTWKVENATEKRDYEKGNVYGALP